MTVADELQKAANSGLQGLTLWPTQDGRWQASTTTDRQSWAVHIQADPAAALHVALQAFLPAASEMKADNSGDIFS